MNVEPGGYRPVNAIAPCASAGAFCATASTSPVDGWMATIAAGVGIAANASLPARSMPMSSVLEMSATGFGSWPPTRCTPAAVCAFTAHPAASSVRCCHRSDNPDSVGDVSALSVDSRRVCGASVTFGIAASCASIGAKSSGRKVIAVIG